jgi:predicted dehydrogenase
VAALKFNNGAQGIWRSCFSALSADKPPMMKAYGSKGTLEVHDHHSIFYSPGGRTRRFESRRNGFYRQFEHFAEAVTRGKKLLFKPGQALADLEFMERIVK